MHRASRLCAAFLMAALALGCAQPVEPLGFASSVHGEERLELPRFDDPLEPVNRSAGGFNHALIMGFVDPLSRIYRLVLPKYVRKRIQNFGNNLVYPRRLVANLFQGKLREAGDETLRFLTNTTVGVAGLYDPATRWGMESHDEDFGQVFGTWGWEPSTFVTLPIIGPSTVRDALGLIPDTLLNPATYFFPAGPALTFNEQADFVEFYRRFTGSNYDPYHLMRIVWMLNRQREVVEPPEELEDTAAVQTLQAVFLAPRDPGFFGKVRTHRIEMPRSTRTLPYSVRLQPGRAPLLYIVPGLGAHRNGDAALALAEMGWNEGFSVVTISNALNFEFMRAASAAIPGHGPVDAADVHAALDAIDRDLISRHPDRFSSRALLGYSLGAFHAFYIAAAATERDNPLIAFDRYVTLDAPVRLIHGMEQIDSFFDAPLALPPEERHAAIRTALNRALDVGQGGFASDDGDHGRLDLADLGEGGVSPTRELPFTDIEAQFLIGLTFRLQLQAVVLASQDRRDLGVLQTEWSALRRHEVYREIADYSFERYLMSFALPYYRDHLRVVGSAEELVAQNDLHSIVDGLAASGRIRHFANENDFLTTDEDLDWLTTVLGAENVRFFPEGGHLGGLYKPAVQKEVMKALAGL